MIDFIQEMLAAGMPLEPEDEPVIIQTNTARKVLDVFWQLHNSRGSNGFGPAAISFSEMAAFQQLTGTRLNPWLVAQIATLDRLFLGAFSAANKASNDRR